MLRVPHLGDVARVETRQHRHREQLQIGAASSFDRRVRIKTLGPWNGQKETPSPLHALRFS